MLRYGFPPLLTLIALTGCAGFWHPRLTDEPLPPHQSLLEAAVRVVLARQPPDSTQTVVLVGPGPVDSVTLIAPTVPVTPPHILRFADAHLASDSLALTLTYVASCGESCSRGGSTIVLHRTTGRNWTVWAVTDSWVEDVVVVQRPH